MATLKAKINLLSYTDLTSSNAPKEVLQDLTKELLDEAVSEVDCKLVSIPALAVDEEIMLDITDIKYIMIENRSTNLHVRFKLNGVGNQEQIIAPEGVLFLKSAINDGTGQITSLHVSNPDANSPLKLRIFTAR